MKFVSNTQYLKKICLHLGRDETSPTVPLPSKPLYTLQSLSLLLPQHQALDHVRRHLNLTGLQWKFLVTSLIFSSSSCSPIKHDHSLTSSEEALCHQRQACGTSLVLLLQNFESVIVLLASVSRNAISESSNSMLEDKVLERCWKNKPWTTLDGNYIKAHLFGSMIFFGMAGLSPLSLLAMRLMVLAVTMLQNKVIKSSSSDNLRGVEIRFVDCLHHALYGLAQPDKQKSITSMSMVKSHFL